MVPRRNVLIFHAGALGDFILTWPLAMALGRLYPQSRVYYVTHASKGALAEKVLRIDSTDMEAGWSALYSPDAALEPPVEKLLGSAHSVFTFVSDGSDAWAGRVRVLAAEAAFFPLRAATLETTGPPHATELLAEQLKAWPAVQTAMRQILRSVADRGVGYRLTPDGSVVLHPGSGSAAKNWPLDRYVELAARLRNAGRNVKFVVGEVEAEKWPPTQTAALAAVGELVRPGDYLELLSTLAAASQFVGNDSGPGHLAGIIGVPTLALFGPTDPAVWKPLGPAVKTLHAPRLEDLAVDEVFSAIR